MNKKLSEMSLQELWELFPIVLAEYNPNWENWYYTEEENIRSILPSEGVIRISHIGSTAIKNIFAKPIIDILIEIPFSFTMEEIKERLINNGFIWMNQSDKRVSLNKGYTEKGFAEKVYHLHLRYEGDNDELYFRDYLIAHHDIAIAYQNLKLLLREKFINDRDGYTNAKTNFIVSSTEKAKLEFPDKYSK